MKGDLQYRIKDLVKSVLTLISPDLNAKIVHYTKAGHWLDFDDPKTFSDKLVVLKNRDYNHNPLVKKYADKYLVREHLEEKGLGDMLNELIAVYDRPEDIEWEKLPKQFAMKLNFASGYNIICADRDVLDREDVVRKFRKWSRSKYYLRFAEMQYKDVKPKILVEKYLANEDGSYPADYKLYCFHGEPKAIQYVADREKEVHSMGFFSPEWDYLGEARKNAKPTNFRPLSVFPPRPRSLDRMIEAARILSEPFPFVRVDFYEVDGRPVFGEMTFTPSTGHNPCETDKSILNMDELL